MASDLPYRTYGVRRHDREPLVRYMVESLESAGCRMLRVSPPTEAPFRLVFETPLGERMGVVAYAFLANSRVTKNRPADEHRFQIKYSGKGDGGRHEIWQDPWELYTTIFLGINVEEGFWVAADPMLHDPTKFFISLEFKQADADRVLAQGWHSWERQKRMREGRRGPMTDWIEVLVGGTADSFLRLIRFERAAKGLDPGHRQLLAEKLSGDHDLLLPMSRVAGQALQQVERPPGHPLVQELELGASEIMDLIESAPRLKMAVRGWVAEEHLVRRLEEVPGVVPWLAVRLDPEWSVLCDSSSGRLGVLFHESIELLLGCFGPRLPFG